MTLLEEMARAIAAERWGGRNSDLLLACAAAGVVADRLDRIQSWSELLRLIDELRGREP